MPNITNCTHCGWLIEPVTLQSGAVTWRHIESRFASCPDSTQTAQPS